MKVYLDLLFLLNFYLDALLLMVTNIVLKRNVQLKKILLGTLIGSTSTLVLFFPISSFFLFLLKIILAILMCLVTFGYKNLKYTMNNISYFYMISIILGGFLYYLKQEFVGSNEILFVFFLIISPVVFYIYIKQLRSFKSLQSLYYKVKIVFSNEQFVLTGFLDTGNKLMDPITKKPIILITKGIVNEKGKKFYYIPFNGFQSHSLVKCLKPLYVQIEEKKYKNYLVAISDKKFHLEGVECLLNNSLLEE